MNVLIDALHRYSGGYLTYLKGLLSSRSIPADITVTVCCSERFIREIGPVDDNVRFIVDKRISSSISKMELWRIFILPHLIRKYKADIHFNPGGQLINFGPHAVPAVSACLNLLPFTKEVRSQYPLFSKFRVYLAMLAFSQSKSFSGADGVIFLNDYIENTLRAQGLKIKQTAVIPFGISEEFRRGREIHPRLTSYRILYVSPLQFYKNQRYVAEGVGLLRRSGLDVSIRFVGGEDPMGSRLLEETRTMLGYPSWIKRETAVPHQEMPNVYADADIFVFASSVENMPNVLIEAMACGLPIACSNIRPMTDILGEGGVYFDPVDPQSIAQAIRTIIEDDELRMRISATAQSRACAYSWKETTRATFEFLRSVAEAGTANKQVAKKGYETRKEIIPAGIAGPDLKLT